MDAYYYTNRTDGDVCAHGLALTNPIAYGLADRNAITYNPYTQRAIDRYAWPVANGNPDPPADDRENVLCGHVR